MLIAVAVLVCLCLALAAALNHQRTKRQQAEALTTQLEAKHRTDLASLRDHHQRLMVALGNLSESVLLCDADGAIIFRNDAADNLAQTSHAHALIEATAEELLEDARAGETAQREIELYGPPSQTLVLHACPLPGGYAMATVEDISHSLRHEIIRRDLVTNIGHELRTPVGALCVLAEAMQQESDPEVLLSLSQSIGTESHRLTQIVNDLLELSQIEHSESLKDKPPMTPVVLQDIVGRAITRVAGVADQNGSHIEADLGGKPVRVLGDSFQLTSAVFNLLDNAVKYSEPNKAVRVFIQNGTDGTGGTGSADGTGRTDGTDRVDIIVQDQGVGISRGDQGRIFERFFRVDRSRSSSVGSGLGLSLVRHVAQLHGGEVILESEEGVGSTFTLRLPTA